MLPNTKLNDTVSHVDQFFQQLPQPQDRFIATYVFLGNNDEIVDMRSKARTMHRRPTSIKDFPVWNFDGSSCGLAKTEDSEVWLLPVFYCLDPFQPTGQNYLVLCENILPDGSNKPFRGNNRSACAIIDEKVKNEEFQFGLEQEFFIMSKDDEHCPLGWPNNKGEGLKPAGHYYCGTGTAGAIGRQVMDSHYRACLYAGLDIHGTNLEVAPSQAEYQIGPCNGIDTADQLWMSRYIMLRVAELYGVNVTFDPKPIPNWSGSGLHHNISTKATRTPDTGYDAILSYMPKFEKTHKLHMAVYGAGNERRLTGQHETQHIDKFTFGVGDRSARIRIPTAVAATKVGYFEDRAIGSNADPYLTCAAIMKTMTNNWSSEELQ